ncbi:MAG: DUF4167 domain-containing protein [Alphaproteobacteria bacterium]
MRKINENSGHRAHRTASGSREQSFDSSGPEGKVRGTAKQLFEKYTILGRDSMSTGDRIVAESFFQYAEHYRRVLSERESNEASSPHKKRNFPPQHRRSREENTPPPEEPRAPDLADKASPGDIQG